MSKLDDKVPTIEDLIVAIVGTKKYISVDDIVIRLYSTDFRDMSDEDITTILTDTIRNRGLKKVKVQFPDGTRSLIIFPSGTILS